MKTTTERRPVFELRADLIAAYVEVGAGEDGNDLLQHGFQELEYLLLARAVHVLVHAPVVWRLCDLLRACAPEQPDCRSSTGSDWCKQPVATA